MRRILSIAIIVIMLMLTLPTLSITEIPLVSAEVSGDYEYTVSEGYATITKYKAFL